MGACDGSVCVQCGTYGWLWLDNWASNGVISAFVVNSLERYCTCMIIMMELCGCREGEKSIGRESVGIQLSPPYNGAYNGVYLGPRPKPTPVRIASCIMHGVLEAGIGLGLGPRLACVLPLCRGLSGLTLRTSYSKSPNSHWSQIVNFYSSRHSYPSQYVTLSPLRPHTKVLYVFQPLAVCIV